MLLLAMPQASKLQAWFARCSLLWSAGFLLMLSRLVRTTTAGWRCADLRSMISLSGKVTSNPGAERDLLLESLVGRTRVVIHAGSLRRLPLGHNTVARTTTAVDDFWRRS